MISIVLADDHEVVRNGLRYLLQEEQDLNIVGEASDGGETVDLVKQHRPDVLILDLSMPGMTGLAAAESVRRESPDTKVVVLSMYSDEGHVQEVLKTGALGYVLKDAPTVELVLAVRAAVAGHRFLSTQISQRAIEAYLNETGEREDPLAKDALTPRERQVLYLTVNGSSTVDIAAQLDISRRTVESHRARFMRKLGLHTRVELVKYAIRMGIVEER